MALIFGCPKAQQVWNTSGIWSKIRNEYEATEGAPELIFRLLDVFDQNTGIDLFAAVMWCLWRHRNEVV